MKSVAVNPSPPNQFCDIGAFPIQNCSVLRAATPKSYDCYFDNIAESFQTHALVLRDSTLRAIGSRKQQIRAQAASHGLLGSFMAMVQLSRLNDRFR